jgi:hypothetical protein
MKTPLCDHSPFVTRSNSDRHLDTTPIMEASHKDASQCKNRLEQPILTFIFFISVEFLSNTCPTQTAPFLVIT